MKIIDKTDRSCVVRVLIEEDIDFLIELEK